ncbi:helix-turn-helix domain-containing protein [Streptomyces coelicoflavus]|uniref:helix-turn-helix domain-containing protein n=1 Tax=Streptomyces coelicoflavus TaxID=285562 RepID=UPI0033290E57
MTLRRKRFAERRTARGYSQEDFAEALAVAVSTVIRWEGGRATPRPHQRPKIADLLGITLFELEGLLVDEPPAEVAAPSDVAALGHSDDDDMRRREVLDLLAVTGALVALPGSDDSPRGTHGRGASGERRRSTPQPVAGVHPVRLETDRLPRGPQAAPRPDDMPGRSTHQRGPDSTVHHDGRPLPARR